MGDGGYGRGMGVRDREGGALGPAPNTGEGEILKELKTPGFTDSDFYQIGTSV